jgi:hypothetical protein
MLTPAASTRSIRWRSVIEIAALFFLCLGLPACEDPPPEPGTPVLQIHGTKPPSIDLSLRIRYIATTEQRQCQQYDMGIPGYKPIEPTWHVWPHEPPSKKPDRRYRVVPMDTTGALPDSLQGQDLEPFRWTVNAGWGGKPKGCDFDLINAEVSLIYKDKNTKQYNLKNEKVGEFDIDFYSKHHYDPGKDIYRIGTQKNPFIICKWGGFKYGIVSLNNEFLNCKIKGQKPSGYHIENKKDSIRLNTHISYINKKGNKN